MKLPSLENENPLTWKCRLFGCRNEPMSLIIDDTKEEHGIKDLGEYTASIILIRYAYRGCIWCMNFTKIKEEEKRIWPIWKCDCDICEESKK